MCCFGLILKLVIGILLAAGVLHFAAWATGNADRGYGTAIACIVVQYIAGIIVGVVITVISCMSMTVALIVVLPIAILVTIYVIQSMYETSWGSAFIMWLISIIVNGAYIAITASSEISNMMNTAGSGGGM